MASSLYHEVRVLYRTYAIPDASDVVCFHGHENGNELLEIAQDIENVQACLHLIVNGCTFTAKSCILDGCPSSPTGAKLSTLLRYELKLATHTSGLILLAEISGFDRPNKTPGGPPVLSPRDHFALTILCQPTSAAPIARSNLCNLYIKSEIKQTNDWVDTVCDIFERLLLFRGPEGDLWDEGKSKIRFALPAFPCKSYNQNKVAGVWPDGAEFEALVHIYNFCAAINDAYPPGCVFEIISDGHVFSDCIGVDDDVVTEYNERLREMATLVSAILKREDLEGALTFNSLHDILQPVPWTRHLFERSFAHLNDVQHPVKTLRSERDDINRGILLHSCCADHAQLQQTIRNDPTNSMTMLYRGFSRFMLDDLAFHPDSKGKSKSQRKKLSEKVALEMMHRNQAYSHLVELAMPKDVRLSIHAHNNKGPKFAISILPQRQFRPLTSFDRLRLSTKYDQYDGKHHLHIPTPWHNCLVQVEGEDAGFVCKAGLVTAELARTDSVWSSRSGFRADHPRGGRYVLHRRTKSDRGWMLAPSTPEEDDVASV